MILGVDLPHPRLQFSDLPLPNDGDVRRQNAKWLRDVQKKLKDRAERLINYYDCEFTTEGFIIYSPNGRRTVANPRMDQFLLPVYVKMQHCEGLHQNLLHDDPWLHAHWTVTPRMLRNLHKTYRRQHKLPEQYKQFEQIECLQFGTLGNGYEAIARWSPSKGWINRRTWRSIRWSPTNLKKPHGVRQYSLPMGYCDWRYPWQFELRAVLPYLGNNYYQALALGQTIYFWLPWIDFALRNPTSPKLKWFDNEWWLRDIYVLQHTL